MDKWSQLNMSDRAKLIKLFVKNGITSLDDIRSQFNSFQDGGPRKTFDQWKQEMGQKYPWLELNSNSAGYDYERYFNENYDDAIARLSDSQPRHFTDKYKLPNHPTFSNESIYSRGPSYGGTRDQNDKFTPSIINRQQYPNIYREYRPYSEEEIYSKKYASGGLLDNPDYPPYTLITNQEGLPEYKLPEVEILAEALPAAKYTDNNVNRYSQAVKNNEIELTQIKDQKLRNAVRAKPVMDNWYNNMNNDAALVSQLAFGIPGAVIGGITAAPVINKVLSIPAVDAALTLDGLVNAPKHIEQGVEEIQEGNPKRGVFDLGLTALDVIGAGKLYRHGNNAAKRLAEVFVRQGDALHGMNAQQGVDLLKKKSTLDYVFGGGKHPELAYNTGPYSGNSAPMPDFFNDELKSLGQSHKGDVVDAFFGKEYSAGKEIDFSDLSTGMQNYINKNYPRKKDKIRIFNLGKVDPADFEIPHNFQSLDYYSTEEEMLRKGGIPVLDPGGYHRVNSINNSDRITEVAEDIWKFNPKDYSSRYGRVLNLNNPNNMLKTLGLKFIDHYGTPVVHTWQRDFIKDIPSGEDYLLKSFQGGI